MKNTPPHHGTWKAGFAALAAYCLLILNVFSAPLASAQVAGGRLPTRWDKDINPAAPLPEYPRPQLVRARWQSLNGPWSLAFTDSAATAPPAQFDGKILVPYPYEAALSGVGLPTPTTQRLWYKRTFAVPAAWHGRRVLLHFGAVNWDSTVTVNGTSMGTHTGGYDPFSFDITPALRSGGNEIVVSAYNPLRHDVPDAQILGKQRSDPGGVLYTGATGIWQTVWLEPVPAVHIVRLKLVPDIDAKALHLTVTADGGAVPFLVTAMDGRTVASGKGRAGTELVLPIANPRLWSPSDPHLYTLKVSLAGKSGDSVRSYFALRKVSLGKDAQGRTRILLNNKFVFQVGALDQGYWPDGIYTAPTNEALKSDIVAAKGFGFNLLRKHAKVEPERWYYWADTLGMLVWQDVPQAFGDHLSGIAKAQWQAEMTREIAAFSNHPSIIVWTLFNEGWGQHDTDTLTALARRLDPTRLLNSASGGYNQIVNGTMSQFRLPTPPGLGDINDTHTYPDPTTEPSDPSRALVCGEFGGISLRVPGHDWNAENFGYGAVMRSGWQLTARYQALLKEARALRDTPGASAVVYTQIADVEDETNGLLTYDRAIVKPLAGIIAAANHGEFLPLPPHPASRDLVPTSEDTAQTWSYTTAKPAEDWTKPAFDASAWKTGQAPFGQGLDNVRTPWIDTPGDIYLRRTVTLPADIPASLDVLARHDEDVEVYINGILAASAQGYTNDYARLPISKEARAALHPGQNVLAVHCRQTLGGQVVDVGLAAN